MARRKADFEAIRSEGGLLPPDLLRRVLDPQDKLPGTKAQDYGLPPGERVNEAITQSWNRLRKHWTDFRQASEELADNEPGTGLTNDRWSLPLLRELGFGVLVTSPGPELGGRTYAINRFAGPVPIHLVGCNLFMDRRVAGVRGAATANPHALVQEYLNRSDESLWGIVANGKQLRILRDNQALSRQSYLEFDLEAIFEGELFGDFVLVWLVGHATRFMPREEGRQETCWLEEWTKISEEQGTRALGDLRVGVEKALQIMGEGFTSHLHNTELRDALRSGALPLSDFHGQLLRVVYRLIFLFVAEDRLLDGQPLLHPPDDSEAGHEARERYTAHYSTNRLRELAGRIKGSRHGDLWRQFQVLVPALFGDESKAAAAAREQLALPALGSFLWNPDSTAALNQAELSNFDFLETLRNLAFTRQDKVLRPVDYKNLGAEELGGVYESLLALTPQLEGGGQRFTFAEFAGSKRKTTGSYYTPDSLVQCLLDSALDPVVAQALEGKSGPEAEEAILALKICDPAVGSGHFLVGAAHRLAGHLARVRAHAQGESEPTALAHQQALRDVIGRCLYGVDINPMAAELCRVGLWLEALEPGKPLTFLEHHIKVGNSLLGATPALLRDGIPDDAFKPIEGDDKDFIKEWKKRNKQERKGHRGMFREMAAPWERLGDLAPGLASLEDIADDTIEGQRRKRQKYQEFISSSSYEYTRLWADAWCAAFVWIKKEHPHLPYPMTEEVFRRIEDNPHSISPAIKEEVRRLAEQYQFFHWYIEFPDVFWNAESGHEAEHPKTGWSGGFDCVLGNPPWEKVKLQEKEWFAQRSPDIANTPNATARKRMIKALKEEAPELHRQFLKDSRQSQGVSHLLRNSGHYPLCGRGDINVYTVFAEGMRDLLSPAGRVGGVLPSGIATDDTTKMFFQDVVENKSLVSLFSFENEELVFPGIHHATRFCLFTAGSGARQIVDSSDFVYFARQIEHLRDYERRFTLSHNDIGLLNPNTRNCPVFRSRRDAELTKAIYRRVPVLVREARDGQPEENPWGIKFLRMFDMTNDSDKFRTRDELGKNCWQLEGNIFRKNREEYLPLYEAKMIHHFDHRWGTYDGQTQAQANQGKLPELDGAMHINPYLTSLPHYWISRDEIDKKIKNNWQHAWFVGFRDITGATVFRTVIVAILPRVAASNNLPLFLTSLRDASIIECFSASLSSFTCDYASRFKVGGTHLNFFIANQIPVLTPTIYAQPCLWLGAKQTLREWISINTLELIYTSWDMEPFALDFGWSGPPFRWDEERRFTLRAELDAAFFHLYLQATADGQWTPARVNEGAVRDETDEELTELKRHFPTPRDAVEHIMNTFNVVRDRDEKAHNGHYRTKDTILEIYDAMAEAMHTGQPYQTRLDPPPGPPMDAEGNFIPMAQWDRANWPSHIHLPKEETIGRPEEVPLEEFAATAYPSTETDRAICAAALAVVEQTGGLSSMEHLDALLMATHPEWCKAFLAQADHRAFSEAVSSCPNQLFVGADQPIGWKESRNYLERLQAISVRHGDPAQAIGMGAEFAAARSSLPSGMDQVASYAIKALKRIAEIREDLSTASQAQSQIMQTLETQHRYHQLAA